MFTGIVEETAVVKEIRHEDSNIHFTLTCSFVNELKIDQSIAHDGVCLTVVDLNSDSYTVTAIDETLNKTNLHSWKKGDRINLERCIRLNDRLDGHMVQGHVDQVGIIEKIEDHQGSFKLFIQFDSEEYITVQKGSVALNGVSLTVVDSEESRFSVAIIPYTWEHTNLSNLKVGSPVNIEFDILGKYIQKLMFRK